MGLWKRILVALALVDEEEVDEEEIDDFEEPMVESPPTIRKIPREEVTAVQSAHAMSRIYSLEPRSFDDAQEIGDRLRDSVPVIMNLQSVEEDLYKRLIAFASGAAYVINGTVQRLAQRVYLITPSSVEVSAEDRKRLVERGLYDEL